MIARNPPCAGATSSAEGIDCDRVSHHDRCMQQLELWRPTAAVDTPPADEGNACVALAVPPPAASMDEDVSHDSLVASYMTAALSERTRLAYANDWRHFERWCAERRERALPASTLTLGRYLAQLAAAGRKSSTIRRARIAIGVVHGQRGLPRPDRDPRIRTLERGIGKVHGTREEGATPLLVPDLERMVGSLGRAVRDDRDRALLLLGFAGAFRSSELVALDVTDIAAIPGGLRVHVRRSKDDQLGEGADPEIPHGTNPLLCPVRSLGCWLAQIASSGPLFPAVHGTRVTQLRLKPRAVTRAIARASSIAGLAAEYSSHSLRSGLATSARLAGRDPRDIQAHGRWQDLRSLARYDGRAAAAAARRAVDGLL